ncbi:hypothetical protein OG352_06185 [Streptomyces sp. NBC_01485]|uniref:hypothetical protein n=1 Tax=Streptomyces sp. NBC_01485 TaxID=2903884 RepID=UPI002E30F814|nr:hypothetical protein [Streptomyces sp. NBC_01485]
MTDLLRTRIAAAIHRYDNHHALSGNDIPSQHHLGEADFVLAELRHELDAPAEPRAEAEELAEARQHLANAYAQRDRLRIRMNALADRWDAALAPDKAYARTLRAEISVAPFHAAPGAEDAAVDEAPAPGCTIGGVPAMPIPVAEYNRLAAAEAEVERLRADIAGCRTQQWPQRLARAERELRRYAAADSADAAAGSYAGRAEAVEDKLAKVAVLRDDLRGITGARWIADALAHILAEPTGPTATQATDGRVPSPTARIRQLMDLLGEILDDAFHGMRGGDGTGPIEHYQARVLDYEFDKWVAVRDGKTRP